MKKILTIIMLGGALLVGKSGFAQDYLKVQHDTVTQVLAGTTFDVVNKVNNLSGAVDTVQWKVMTFTWPSDWSSSLGICDNFDCYSTASVWPTVTKQCGYAPGLGDFKLQGDLSSATSVGPYVLRIRFNRKSDPLDTAWQTYILSKSTTSVTKVKAVSTDVTLYPNPASNTLNVVYDAAADIKTVAIYSIIGKQMNVFRATDNNSASLNIENLPSGIYFVRLLNAQGDVFATRKFTKQ